MEYLGWYDREWEVFYYVWCIVEADAMDLQKLR